jgi:hypothetical protein
MGVDLSLVLVPGGLYLGSLRLRQSGRISLQFVWAFLATWTQSTLLRNEVSDCVTNRFAVLGSRDEL